MKKIRETTPSKKYSLIRDNHQLIDERLRVGMTKNEVQDIVGEPQNANSRYVWMWCEEFDERKHHIPGNAWQSMRSYREGFYLVFHEDRLVTQFFMKNAEGYPWEVLANHLHISRDEARLLMNEE